MYADLVGQIVPVAVSEGASVDVRLEVERVKQVIGSELATSSSTCCLRSWRRFSSYCASNWMDFLPAKVDTVLVNLITLRVSTPTLLFVTFTNFFLMKLLLLLRPVKDDQTS